MLKHKCFNFSANAPSNSPFCTFPSHPQPGLIHLDTNLHFISSNPISINRKVSTEKAASEAKVPVCCALRLDEGTWVSHPLGLTRICNLRGKSSSPDIPMAHGDDQATLWTLNGSSYQKGKRWRNLLVKSHWCCGRNCGQNSMSFRERQNKTFSLGMVWLQQCFDCPFLID